MAFFPSFLAFWNYRKRIKISGSSGAGTNYQVLLKIGESYTTWTASTAYNVGALVKPTAGSNSFFYECTTAGTSGTTEPTWPTTDGATVTDGTITWTARKGLILDGKSAKFPSGTNDGGDLRFTDADSLSLQSFWVEKVTGTSPNRVAYIWVKVSADLSSDQYLYCYFGNSNATNMSNGADTFIFFDDFESYAEESDINGQGGWITKRVGGTGEAKVRTINGRKHLRLKSTDRGTTVIRPQPVSNYGVAIRVYNYEAAIGDALEFSFSTDQINSDGNTYVGYTLDWWGWGGGSSRINRSSSGSYTPLASISDSTMNNIYHTSEFAWFSSSLRGFRNGELKLSATDSVYSLLTHIHIHAWSPSDRYIDWVILRRYTYPEPSFSLADELEERSLILITLNGWEYRKPFSIVDRSGNDLTNYSICLKIGERSTSTNYDFHLGGFSAKFPSGTNDGGDLRFYDGANGLSFWVEKVVGTAPNRVAYVWVKIPYLSAYQTKTLWCYFGNLNATNVSNGDNTFILFDDFNTTSLNTIKWTPVGDYSISNSIIQMNPNHVTNTGTIDGLSLLDGIYSNLLFTYPIEIKTRIAGHTIYVRYKVGLIGLYYQYDDDANYCGLIFSGSRVSTWGYDVPSNGLVGDVIVRITSNSFYLKDPSSNTPRTWNYGLNNNPNNYRIILSSWYTSDISIDYITVRKYTFPEPTIIPWSGDIEKNFTPSSYFIVSYKQRN